MLRYRQLYIDRPVQICYLFVVLAEMLTCALPLTLPVGSDLICQEVNQTEGLTIRFSYGTDRMPFLTISPNFLRKYGFSGLPFGRVNKKELVLSLVIFTEMWYELKSNKVRLTTRYGIVN